MDEREQLPHTAGFVDVTHDLDAPVSQPPAAPAEGPTTDMPKKAARKTAQYTKRKTTPPRARKAAAPKTRAPIALPAMEELRLAPNGIRTDGRNRYVNIEFTNCFTVRLFPVGVSPADVPRVRDLMVAWLQKLASR